MVWEADQDASLLDPCRGVPGISNVVETTGQTMNRLEGLYIPSSLGMSQDTPRRTGGRSQGEGCMGLAIAFCHHDPERECMFKVLLVTKLRKMMLIISFCFKYPDCTYTIVMSLHYCHVLTSLVNSVIKKVYLKNSEETKIMSTIVQCHLKK